MSAVFTKNLTLRKSILLLTIFLMQGCSNAKTVSLVSIPLELDLRIKCTYRHGNSITERTNKDLLREENALIKTSLQIVDNSSDMIWDFFDLKKEKPYLISDGDVIPVSTFMDHICLSYGEKAFPTGQNTIISPEVERHPS